MTKVCPSSRCLLVIWRASVISHVPLIRRVEGPLGMCCICERFITTWGYYRGYHVSGSTLVPRLEDLLQICWISRLSDCPKTWRQINKILTDVECCRFLFVASGTLFYRFTSMKIQNKLISRTGRGRGYNNANLNLIHVSSYGPI